eukprot:CAMPEP_0203643568 /NCGR_PEP_ID=MMETSP0088-20131115/9011_1 /ASSEMBLY_ACC=CAM_ASM_001087 /TAXON_ID=426623 /ORGANISM="Chaetoceros affinis, Strain CCMP159" /LENGTH=35 /DNA_ID= /DNA_START= /DNA_END= /DNA_ORIENTATION=
MLESLLLEGDADPVTSMSPLLIDDKSNEGSDLFIG